MLDKTADNIAKNKPFDFDVIKTCCFCAAADLEFVATRNARRLFRISTVAGLAWPICRSRAPWLAGKVASNARKSGESTFLGRPCGRCGSFSVAALWRCRSHEAA